jgi:hypothetical protein
MAFQPGHKLSPGREKGVPNRTSKALISQLEDIGMGSTMDHPVIWMFKVAHGETKLIREIDGAVIESGATPELRVTCMKEVAKYVSPQLKAIEHSVDPETKVQQFTMIQLVPMDDSTNTTA